MSQLTLVLLAVMFCALNAYGQTTEEEVNLLLKLHCGSSESVKAKAKDCLKTLPQEVEKAREQCRADVVPESNGNVATFAQHLCAGPSGNREIAEKVVKCGQNLRKEKAKTLTDENLKAVLEVLICLRNVAQQN